MRIDFLSDRRFISLTQTYSALLVSCSTQQVNYSLVYRGPETSGVLETLREEGVTLMAYSPLAQGLLTGKFNGGGKKVEGPRKMVLTDRNVGRMTTLLSLMDEVGKEHGGKTKSQVALNWLMSQPGVFPIPGAKSEAQVKELAGAMGWRLTEGEWTELDKEAKKILKDGDVFQGAPFEKW